MKKLIVFLGFIALSGGQIWSDCSSKCSEEELRKFNAGKFFHSLAATVNSVGTAAVSEPKTKEEKQQQQVDAISSVLSFVGDTIECTEDKKDVKRGKTLETVFVALKQDVEARSDELVEELRLAVRSKILGETSLRDVTPPVESEPAKTDVASQVDPEKPSKIVMTLFAAAWKLVEEILTQENISEYLKEQVDLFIDHLYGKIIGEIKEEVQESLENSMNLENFINS